MYVWFLLKPWEDPTWLFMSPVLVATPRRHMLSCPREAVKLQAEVQEERVRSWRHVMLTWWCPQLCFLIYRMFIKGFINLYSLLTQCGSMFHDFSSQSRCIFQCRWQLFAGILDLQDSCSVAGLNESSLGTQLAARDQKQLCTWLQLIRSSPNEPESVDFLLKTRVKTLTVLKRWCEWCA